MTPPNDAKAVLGLALDRDLMVRLLRESHNDWLDHGRYTGADGRDQMVPEEHWILARLRQQTERADHLEVEKGLAVGLWRSAEEQLRQQTERAEAAEQALAWYSEKATAMHRYMERPIRERAMEAICVELALDNGKRAALAENVLHTLEDMPMEGRKP